MFPYLGFGLGFRLHYYEQIIKELPPVDWFEIMTEDYLVAGGLYLHNLEQLREHYPLVMHGVSLSIGGSDDLDFDYLTKVKNLAQRISPVWISDHLCWTGVHGKQLHDLYPLPYTEEAIKHIVKRVKQVQEFLGRQILLENVSSYITYKDSSIEEWDFLTAIANEADCYILLDVNNIYVSAFNHGFDPKEYLNKIPIERVKQFHLAGHDNQGEYIIDTHDEPIVSGVWALYADAVQRFGAVSTMIERDSNFPPLSDLLTELTQARTIANNILRKVDCRVD